MNILWISFYGSWTLPLLNEIRKKVNGKIGIIVPDINGKKKFTIEIKNDITFYTVPFHKKELLRNMSIETFHKFERIIKDFEPDIIHVHGTEKNLGQIQNFISTAPIIISIQGIIRACRPYYLNYLDRKDIFPFKTIKNLIGRGGTERTRKIFARGKEYETNIIIKGKYFFTRTLWDTAHVSLENPKAQIFQGEEILREEFYKNAGTWNVTKCKKYRIFMPSGSDPLKGLHQAIEVIRLLKNEYPSIQLIVPGIKKNHINQGIIKDFLFGEEYIRYIKSLVKKYSLQQNVIFLKRLEGNEMVEEMQKANVFLSPSSIDNSPNAVGEAMMIGTPIVVTPVGGIPSFMTDEKDCLFAAAGDPYIMAYQIKRICNNMDLACLLSNNATLKAQKRHCVKNTTEQYIETYKRIINNHEGITL